MIIQILLSLDLTSNPKHGTEKWITKDPETRKTITQKDEKLVLHKKVENADLDKPALNKIMTTCEKGIKYYLVAPFKYRRLFNVFYCVSMFVNRDIAHLECAYLKKLKAL